MHTQPQSSDPTKWMVGTSTASLAKLLTGEESQALSVFKDCRAAGLQCIELMLAASDLSGATAQAFRRYDTLAQAAREAGLQIWSIHLPFSDVVDISQLDATQRAASVALDVSCLRWAAAQGVTTAVVHASAQPILADEREQRLVHSARSLQQLAGIAEQVGITLAAECLPYTCLANSSSELADLLANMDNVQVCMDVNHVMKESHSDFIRHLGGRIRTVHISDFDGEERHWLPGMGMINWTQLVRELATAGYPGPWVFEVRSQLNGRITLPADLAACWREILCGIKPVNKP